MLLKLSSGVYSYGKVHRIADGSFRTITTNLHGVIVGRVQRYLRYASVYQFFLGINA